MRISPFFFFAPEVHLRGLEEVGEDLIVCAHGWSTFIGKLQTEWQEFVLYATVLVNANVGFLTLPSVDNGSHYRGPAQLACYISVIFGTGSIITGLMLTRQHRDKLNSAPEAGAFLKNTKLEALAIIYSIPFSLLMWALISFFVAFLLECLLKPSDSLSRIPVVIAWMFVGTLAMWCVRTWWYPDCSDIDPVRLT